VVAVVSVALLGTVTSCAAGDTTAIGRLPRSVPTSATPAQPVGPPVGPQYVALGDSFAAAPGVPVTSGADGCFRSSSNYATALATSQDLTVTDVTCSGATTDSVLDSQVPEITARARLVTLGIGGNDFDLFTRLIGGCIEAASSDPDGTPCTDAARAEVEDVLPRISANIGGVLDAVAEAAPRARVVVVGYPDLLPTSGSCPDRVPFAEADYAFVNEISQGLSSALREQADRHGSTFVDLGRPSRGHDICSDAPWVNGATVADDGTIPFHPFAVEQQAVATIIARLL
jgi:hypothetical protein